MRTSRVVSGTDVYHVMARGNGKREIFLDEIDNKYFLKLLIAAKNKYEAKIYAYCLMGNHYHLLVKSRELPDFCKEVNQTYAHYFNAKNKTVGHVFQGRYKSFPVENGEYLLCVLRYIHNNPVKAGVSESPGGYPWSSYEDYLTGKGLTTTYPILRLFDSNLQTAKAKFNAFSSKIDEFDYESAKSAVFFADYRKGKSILREWLKENEELTNEDLRTIDRAIKNETSLSEKDIIDILGISKTKYYKKIVKVN